MKPDALPTGPAALTVTAECPALETQHLYHLLVPSTRLPAAAAWLIALVAAATLLAATGYRTRDPDSRAYIAITTQLVNEPVDRWIAPQWWGAWAGQGRFLEHPAGTFVPPALLARAGYPVAQSLFVVTLTCQVVSVLALVALASRFLPMAHARAVGWALLLLPIAFVFRVRANQEYLVLAGILVAVYGLDRARRSAGWVVVAAAGCLFALAVKGVFALVAPVVGALWLWARRPTPGAAWGALAVMTAAVPLGAWAYENAYARVTGESFLDYYLGARMSLEAGVASTLPFPLDKLWNVLWYAGRVAWYAAPWSLVLLSLVGPAARARMSVPARRFTTFAMLAALAAILLVAARDMRADRYIFPAYFFAASGGVAAACALAPRVSGLAERLDRLWPWGPAALWLALVAGRVLL